ncbi:MAG: hypothetical protein LBF63_07130 [Treponema sp.]|jgi:hypothetical protein|nr:hypothetical protein [Treponema sp.]
MESVSSAAQVIIAIIPIVGIVWGSVLIFFYLLWNYRHKTLLVKAGQYVPPRFDLLSFSLLAGLLLETVGLTLTIFLAIVQGASYVLLGGLIPLSIGTGFLIYYGIKRGDRALRS